MMWQNAYCVSVGAFFASASYMHAFRRTMIAWRLASPRFNHLRRQHYAGSTSKHTIHM